jgi:hypothetical protein
MSKLNLGLRVPVRLQQQHGLKRKVEVPLEPEELHPLVLLGQTQELNVQPFLSRQKLQQQQRQLGEEEQEQQQEAVRHHFPFQYEFVQEVFEHHTPLRKTTKGPLVRLKRNKKESLQVKPSFAPLDLSECVSPGDIRQEHTGQTQQLQESQQPQHEHQRLPRFQQPKQQCHQQQLQSRQLPQQPKLQHFSVLDRHAESGIDTLVSISGKRQCLVCSKTFSTVEKLLLHFRKIHPKEKSFLCSYCDAEFVDKARLEFHLKGVHKIKFVDLSSLGTSISTDQAEAPKNEAEFESWDGSVPKLSQDASGMFKTPGVNIIKAFFFVMATVAQQA